MSMTEKPSRLVLLPQIPSQGVGDKVRFLGCVEQYDIPSAILRLSYSYQAEHLRTRPRSYVNVDIALVLDKVKASDLQVGAWLNVIGYITDPVAVERKAEARAREARVQAVLLWNTDNVQLLDYERAVKDRQEMSK